MLNNNNPYGIKVYSIFSNNNTYENNIYHNKYNIFIVYIRNLNNNVYGFCIFKIPKT
jgi:hypothetical protein